jgi:hypothetical protein
MMAGIMQATESHLGSRRTQRPPSWIYRKPCEIHLTVRVHFSRRLSHLRGQRRQYVHMDTKECIADMGV